MDEESISRYILETFEGLDIVEANGDTFFFYDPHRSLPVDKRQPFATIVTSDQYENVSNLDRAGVFRLNVGATPTTYRSLFGAQPGWGKDGGAVDTGHDFSALDVVMPHPVYAPMSWVCVLNPTGATFESVKPLLAESYALAVRRHVHRSDQSDQADAG